jgi:hypothetical protein
VINQIPLSGSGFASGFEYDPSNPIRAAARELLQCRRGTASTRSASSWWAGRGFTPADFVISSQGQHDGAQRSGSSSRQMAEQNCFGAGVNPLGKSDRSRRRPNRESSRDGPDARLSWVGWSKGRQRDPAADLSTPTRCLRYMIRSSITLTARGRMKEVPRAAESPRDARPRGAERQEPGRAESALLYRPDTPMIRTLTSRGQCCWRLVTASASSVSRVSLGEPAAQSRSARCRALRREPGRDRALLPGPKNALIAAIGISPLGGNRARARRQAS